MIEGCLTITSGEASEVLNHGDTGRYAADIDHAISSKDGARAMLIVMTE